MTYCVSSRAMFNACGMFFLFAGSMIQMVEQRNLTLAHRSSWVDALQNRPNSFQLISPLLALELASDINRGTTGPVYVNGFTLGDVEKGGVIQMINSSKEYGVFCANGLEIDESFAYEILKQGTYEEGRRNCFLKESHFRFFLTVYTLDMVGYNFRNTWFWMDDMSKDIPSLVLGDETYRPVIKRQTNSLAYPLYDTKKNDQETTINDEKVVLTSSEGITTSMGLKREAKDDPLGKVVMYISIPVGVSIIAALVGLFVWKKRRKLSTNDCHEGRSRGGPQTQLHDRSINDHETIPEEKTLVYGNVDVNICGAINKIYDEHEGVVEVSDNTYMNRDNCLYSPF